MSLPLSPRFLNGASLIEREIRAAGQPKGYGMANVELGVPITTETILGAASISKQFTAMSILLLAQRVRLSIDDEVSRYVPEWMNHENHVTITHTSGLREGFMLLGLAQQNVEENMNEAMVRVLARQKGVNFARARNGNTTTAVITCSAASSSG
jgi:CubicO group peptidase (beta-lactamase class C family)